MNPNVCLLISFNKLSQTIFAIAFIIGQVTATVYGDVHIVMPRLLTISLLQTILTCLLYYMEREILFRSREWRMP